MNITNLSNIYKKEGFISGIKILSEEEARKHRNILENTEKKIGNLHYKPKIHTLLNSPFLLATNYKILDIVEKILGPNILLHNVTYIIKESQTPTFVSWHQDLTYWGFNSDDQVSVWLALSPTTKESGCMQMIPKSHTWGKLKHNKTFDRNNVLSSGQTIKNIDESKSKFCILKPGEASFHHGWILHKSNENFSNDRRIGLNIQYIATHVKQIKHNNDSAICVRGEDKYKNFNNDIPANNNNKLDSKTIQVFEKLGKLYKNTQKMN